jgi:polysaccharide biosynthesis protein PslH
MKILWVKAGGLVPPDTGGKIRSYNILRQLAKHHSVTFFSFYAAHENDLHPELGKVFERVVSVPLHLPEARRLRELLDYGLRLFSREPYNIAKYCRPRVRRELRKLLERESYDVILVDFLVASGAIPWNWPCPKVLFTHNVEAVIWQRHFEVAKNPLWKALCWREWKAMAGAERHYLQQADHVLTVSDHDKAAFARFLDPARLTVVPTGADTEFFCPGRGEELPDSLVFTGSMDWLPNEDGIFYFAHEILPLIRKRIPSISLCVVGRKPSRRMQDLAASEPGLELTGWVEDVRPYLERGAVCIVPLRIGGGTRLKIFEAMSMAKAVVSTTIGAEGLPVRDGEHLLVADSAVDFAERTVALLADPVRRSELGRAARRLVEERYSWTTVAKGFADVLGSVIDQGRRHGQEPRFVSPIRS